MYLMFIAEQMESPEEFMVLSLNDGLHPLWPKVDLKKYD